MQIFIVTEGGINIGLGHMARCTAIDQAFRTKNLTPVWIINGDKSVADKDALWWDWLKHREQVLDKVKNSQIVIVDSYLLERSFYSDLSKIVKTPVYLDDNSRLKYPRGIIVNGSIGAQAFNYPSLDDREYLLGTDYIPLRSEFWDVKDKKINKDVTSVLVTFGGDDSKAMTIKTLKILKDNYPGLTKNVVIGKSFQNKHEIEAFKDDQTTFMYSLDAQSMKDLMLNSDIAISAGGQTLYELARIGVPTVAVAVADNQKNNVEGWAKEGFIEFAGWWNDKNIFDQILNKIERLLPYEARMKRKAIGAKLVDGQGAQRIVSACLK